MASRGGLIPEDTMDGHGSRHTFAQNPASLPRAIARYCYSLLFIKSGHKALALAEDCLDLVLILCQSHFSGFRKWKHQKSINCSQ